MAAADHPTFCSEQFRNGWESGESQPRREITEERSKPSNAPAHPAEGSGTAPESRIVRKRWPFSTITRLGIPCVVTKRRAENLQHALTCAKWSEKGTCQCHGIICVVTRHAGYITRSEGARTAAAQAAAGARNVHNSPVPNDVRRTRICRALDRNRSVYCAPDCEASRGKHAYRNGVRVPITTSAQWAVAVVSVSRKDRPGGLSPDGTDWKARRMRVHPRGATTVSLKTRAPLFLLEVFVEQLL